ncbi:GTPase domain-containing protein [Effusibacillus consociatus]|uniref:GTPase domain-containing protein n=1 Tax=Effusibacillus consociatus TaxID=1117041 RepID=A0ABV9PVY2_9BACL
MRNCLVLGRTNVGKTMFCVNFAEFLGLHRLEVFYQLPDGSTRQKKYDLSSARHELSGLGQHKTRSLQSIQLDLPGGKGARKFTLTDSTGLTDGVHPDRGLREAMAQTLGELKAADCILHMVDLGEVAKAGSLRSLGELDLQIAEFGEFKDGYAMLANKMDLPEAKKGLALLQEEMRGTRIIPISSIYRQGFREVKEYVWRLV